MKHFEDLKAHLEPMLTTKLEPLYQDFQTQTGLKDLDLFLEYLRSQGLIEDQTISELYADDQIEITKLDVMDMTQATMPEASNPVFALAHTPSREHYDRLGQVGAGAMGLVYLAKDQDLMRKVALKQLLPEMGQNARLKARFLSEVQITAQLEHPNIVPIYSLEVAADGTLAYAMKLSHGQTFKEIIRDTKARFSQGKPDEAHSLPALLDHFLKVCDAMHYAHSKGVIHRDLKPANIMVGPFNEVYVMDWGIAKLVGTREELVDSELGSIIQAQQGQALDNTAAGQILGTPRYMSPQQAAGKNDELDARSDQFALGLILFELVSLKPAFTAKTTMALLKKVLKAQKEPLVPYSPKQRIPKELEAIIHKATAQKSGPRYPDVKALADDIRRYLEGKAVLAQPDTWLQSLLRWMNHHRQATMLAFLGILLISAGAIIGSLYSHQAALAQAQHREEQLGRFLTSVSHQSQQLENRFLRFEGLLQGLTKTASVALTQGQPQPEPVYLDADFAAQKPGDLFFSPRYGKQLSLTWPVYKLAPGVVPAEVQPVLQRLNSVRHYYRAMFSRRLDTQGQTASQVPLRAQLEQTNMPLVWAYIGLQSGIHSAYPGKAGYPPDFDPRQRPWYKAALGKWGPQWGQPYQDAQGQGTLLACSQALYTPDQRFLGVAGLDLTLDYVAGNLLKLPGNQAVRRVFLVNGQGRIVVKDAAPETTTARREFGLVSYPGVVQGIRAKRSGFVETVGQELIAYSRLNTLGWYFVVVADARALFARGIQ